MRKDKTLVLNTTSRNHNNALFALPFLQPSIPQTWLCALTRVCARMLFGAQVKVSLMTVIRRGAKVFALDSRMGGKRACMPAARDCIAQTFMSNHGFVRGATVYSIPDSTLSFKYPDILASQYLSKMTDGTVNFRI